VDLLEVTCSTLCRALRAALLIGADYCFPLIAIIAFAVVASQDGGWLFAVGAFLHGGAIISNRFLVRSGFASFLPHLRRSRTANPCPVRVNFSEFFACGVFPLDRKNPNNACHPTDMIGGVWFWNWSLSRSYRRMHIDVVPNNALASALAGRAFHHFPRRARHLGFPESVAVRAALAHLPVPMPLAAMA